MAERNLTYDDLVQIVQLVKSTSQFSEFRLRVGDIEVSLTRANGEAPRRELPPATAPQRSNVEAPPQEPKKREARALPSNLHAVKAPMVGTFYRASAPGQPPFVEVGQTVEPDAIVCIIEVMKLMNSIEAGVRGTVREILVENAQAVEYGEPLVLIEPAK